MGLQQSSITYFNSSFRHDYLCQYLPHSAGKDTLSLSLLRFKNLIQPDLDAWIDCSLDMLKEITLPAKTIILRALQHGETIATSASPTALDLLGRSLADHFICPYLPTLLQKSRPSLPCKELSRDQRLAELRNIYSINPVPVILPSASVNLPENLPSALGPSATSATSNNSEHLPTVNPSALPSFLTDSPILPSFLLIDDILTTGTTMRMIIRTLRRQFPRCPIRIFTLARSNYDAHFNKSTPPHGQIYHLEEDGSGWTVAEEAQDFNQPNSHMKTLKECIYANSF